MKFQKMFAALALSFAVIACSKEQAAPEDEAAKPQEPQTEQTDVPEGYVRLTFSTPAETKTSIDKESGAVSWSEHDQIKICWEGGSAVSDEVAIEGGVARFTANVAEAAEDLYAVYPSSLTASVSSGTLSVDIPQSQTGLFKDADIIVAKTTKTELTYAFHHAVSLVRFVISEGNSRNITRAQFVDLANNSCLYGTLGITFSGTDIDEITEPTAEANDVIDITAVDEGDNWIAVPPTKSLTGYGLRMGTSSAWLPGIVGEKAYAFSAAGKRLGLGTVDEKINDGDWYIKPEATGTGDGKSWANAGGSQFLQSLMGSISEYQDEYKNLARGWRVDGTTIKVAEGVYGAPGSGGYTSGYGNTDAFPSGISFTIEGGYTTNGTKAAATAQTIFGSDDDENPSTSRAFFFYHGVDVTLKDVIIKNNHRAHDGGALYLIQLNKFRAVGCEFSSNIANAASRSGGAIFARSTTLSLQDCEFSANKAGADGGAIYLVASHLDAQNCLFSSNTCWKDNTERNGSKGNDFDQGGGAIMAYAATSHTAITADNPVKVNLNGCKFDGNRAMYSTGGVFYAQATHLLFTADHCKFLNNRSNGNYSGPVIASESPSGTDADNIVNFFFNACEFRGNKSENFTSYIGPSIGFIHYAYTNLGFNNCMFNENVSTNSLYGLYTRGALIFVNSTMVDAQSKGSTALLLAGNIAESYPATIVNSIAVNTSTKRNGVNVGTDMWTSSYLTFDHNLYGSYDISSSVPSDKGNVLVTSLNDGSAEKIDAIDGGMSYYSWSGSAMGFSQTSKSAVGNAIKSNTKFGTKFYNWLDSLVDGAGTALDYDIRGEERSSGYWPGSFQNN